MVTRNVRMGLCKFSKALYSVFKEWMLILLLFVDTFCLYLLRKIFRSSKLQTPCLVCSRFTYFFGNEKLRFYNDFACDAHKLEISTFAFCYAHKKLVDSGKMCESCLLSCAQKKSTLEKFKFLLSKLSVDPDDDDRILNTSSDEMVKVPLLENDEGCSLCENLCSCCSNPCHIKPSSCMLFEHKPILKEFAFPGFRSTGERIHSIAYTPDRLNKSRGISSMQLTNYQQGDDHGLGPHFLYRELRFSSDSESEAPCSGDDVDGSIKAPQTKEVKEEFVSQNLMPSTCATDALKVLNVVSDNEVPEKLIHLDSDLSDASSISKSQLNEDGSYLNSFVQPKDHLGHGLEEINWIDVGVKSTPLSSQITSKLVPTVISNVEEFAGLDVSRVSSPKVEVNRNLNLTDLSSKPEKIMSEPDDNLSSGAKGAKRITKSSEISMSLSRESARIHDDLKKRRFQLPHSLSLESSWTDFNLSSGKDTESKLSDTSLCHGLQSVFKKLDTDLSYLESSDGSPVCEIGECSADFFKRQSEMGHNLMSNLYKELEEERNASAIAANQAMAMINKVQEEKAAMQLEVMQYSRMMEEQAVYEHKALQKLNDQLIEREKQIKELEAELEGYRKRCWVESFVGKNEQGPYDSDESEHSTSSTPHVLKHKGWNKNHPRDSACATSGSMKGTVLDFEDEREYILEYLKRLEKNARLFSCDDASRHDEEDDELNDDSCQCIHEDATSLKRLCTSNIIEENCLTQPYNPIGERISSAMHLSTSVESLPHEEWESAIKENERDILPNSSFNNNKHSKTSKRSNVISLGDEVEHLRARLEALEADRDFLERTINSLRNGKDGLQFVQEIATHLREIRKIGSMQREKALA